MQSEARKPVLISTTTAPVGRPSRIVTARIVTARVVVAIVSILALVGLTPGIASASCGQSAAAGVDWTGCSFRFSELNDANLVGADLTGSDMSYSVLFRANLSGAVLRGANFQDAFPVGANLSGVDAAGANFLDADLVGSDLTNASFRGANLEGADLDYASIAGANFSGAVLTGTDFVNVTGAASAIFGAPAEAVADTAVTTVGKPVVINVLANDPSAANPGAIKRAVLATAPANGTFNAATGLYRPSAGFSGIDTFTYTPVDRITAVNLPTGAKIDYSGPAVAVTVRVIRPVVLAAPYAGASGSRGEIARLYAAVLNRSPEAEGFDYWLAQRTNGKSLDAITAAFLASSEFLGTSDQLSNEQFLILVYNNVFARNPDAEGHQFWLAQLSGGMSRSRVVLQFANGAEFKALTGTS